MDAVTQVRRKLLARIWRGEKGKGSHGGADDAVVTDSAAPNYQAFIRGEMRRRNTVVQFRLLVCIGSDP